MIALANVIDRCTFLFNAVLREMNISLDLF